MASIRPSIDASLCIPVFKPGISVLGPRGPYPKKNWGHMKKCGDSTINDQNFIENISVGILLHVIVPVTTFEHRLTQVCQ